MPWQGFCVVLWWGGVAVRLMCSGACVQRVGIAGLARRGRAHVWQVGTMARFSQGGLVPKLGMHAMLGWCRSSVAASLARCDRVVAADLRVAKGGGGGHGLHAVRQWGLVRLEEWSEKERKKKRNKHNFTCVPANGAMAAAGLARLEGRGMVERWGFEDPACGEKRSLQHWSEKKRKKKKKNITLLACL